ncbi:hypothetical protein A5728_05085 [Kocuria sp. ICS0012]|nr:hypothetical protein A5728_05085 [Kocuria sp. ICS0012]
MKGITVPTPSTRTRPLAFITGASNGIGTDIARELATRGYDIIGTGRSDSIDTVAEQLRALGATVYPVRADLRTYENMEKLWDQVEAIARPPDVAVLNAGEQLVRAVREAGEPDLGSLEVREDRGRRPGSAEARRRFS